MNIRAFSRARLTAAMILVLAGVLFAAVAAGAEEAFGGVGLQVVPLVSGELVVLRVVDDSPAADVGMRPGDLVFRVDDQPLAGLEFATVVKDHLWGKPGSPVRLTFLRPGAEGERSVTLRRVAMDPAVPAPPGVDMLRPEGK